MQNLLERLIGFDRLIGPILVKVVYWTGLAGIALFVLGFSLAGLMTLGADVIKGLMQLLGAVIVGLVALAYWRFMCELFMLAFLAFERLGEIRDRLGAPAGAGPGPAPSPTAAAPAPPIEASEKPADFSQF